MTMTIMTINIMTMNIMTTNIMTMNIMTTFPIHFALFPAQINFMYVFMESKDISK